MSFIIVYKSVFVKVDCYLQRDKAIYALFGNMSFKTCYNAETDGSSKTTIQCLVNTLKVELTK